MERILLFEEKQMTSGDELLRSDPIACQEVLYIKNKKEHEKI